MSNLKSDKFPISVVLDDIRSALNVGAIFRTCDCTGVDKLFLAGITPYPPHNRIPKTALGAIDTVDWSYSKDKLKIIQNLKEKGNKIISIEITNSSKNIYEYNFEFPVAVVFGNEISGVDKAIMEQSDDIIHIPMFGSKESLNVATTCGIVLYEIVRQLNYNS